MRNAMPLPKTLERRRDAMQPNAEWDPEAAVISEVCNRPGRGSAATARMNTVPVFEPE